MSVDQLVNKIVVHIIDPTLTLLAAIAMLVFVWGFVEFLASLNGYGERKGEGKRHMFWGIVGLFVIFSAKAIIAVISNTVCSGSGCI